jgi:DNA polymerase III sliding clamp (beta) subunit (PCNA family)
MSVFVPYGEIGLGCVAFGADLECYLTVGTNAKSRSSKKLPREVAWVTLPPGRKNPNLLRISKITAHLPFSGCGLFHAQPLTRKEILLMIPITLPVAELKSALTGLSKVIHSRTTTPGLQCIKLERTTEGWIALTTTDQDHFITVRLEQPSTGDPVSLLVPFERLASLIKSCRKDEQIHITTAPLNGVIIKFALASELGESAFKSPPIAEFPQIPRIAGNPAPLPPPVRLSIHEAMACSSEDPTRMILHGAFIDASQPKTHYVVATDGKHLYSSNSFDLPLKVSVLIPKHKFLGWREFNNDGEWQMKTSETWLQISSRRWRFITKQLEGVYPKWRHVVPEQAPKTIITLEPDCLEALMQTIEKLPCHDETHQTIGIELKERQLQLLARKENGEPWIRVPVTAQEIRGIDVTAFVNRQYLLKALRFGLYTIGLIDEISPLRFSNQGKLMIAMPLRPDALHSPPRPVPRPKPTPPPPTNPPMNEPSRPPHQPPQPAPEQPLTMDAVIDAVHQVRESFISGVNKLRDLGLQLKHLQREQRTSSRELNTVRSIRERE